MTANAKSTLLFWMNYTTGFLHRKCEF